MRTTERVTVYSIHTSTAPAAAESPMINSLLNGVCSLKIPWIFADSDWSNDASANAAEQAVNSKKAVKRDVR